MATRPRLRQHTFDHLRHLIHKIKDRAVTRQDAEISNDADLLDALLVLFVEEFILEGSINVKERKVRFGEQATRVPTQSEFASDRQR